MPHSKMVSYKLFELRIRGKKEVRIFYTFKNDYAFLLHSFVKKTQKIPARELNVAIRKLKSID